jgi:beta-lactamase regulating signal transducer with metallopeptidase domain
MKDIILNIYLPHFFGWVIVTSIMASILVGIILLIKILFGKKLNPRWHYLLWIILVVRLILPWSPSSSFSIYSVLSNSYEKMSQIQHRSYIFAEHEQNYNTMQFSTETVPEVYNSKDLNGELRIILERTKEKNSKNKQGNKPPISFHFIAIYIWLAGVIVLYFITYITNKKIYNTIKKQAVIPKERIVEILEKCKESMGISRDIPLILAGELSSPTVLGFFRPKILLSNQNIKLNDQQLRHIFYHELAHIKRGDVALNWLMHCLVILNWFNPIIWLAYFWMREDQEVACDAYALTFMEESERIHYGLTLISLLEQNSIYYYDPSLANLSRNKRTMKRRILMIKKFGKKSYAWSALGITAIIVVGSLTLLNAEADVENQKSAEKTQLNEDISTQNSQVGLKNNNENGTFASNEVSKEEILERMNQTHQFFDTVQGKLSFVDRENNINESVDYKINLLPGESTAQISKKSDDTESLIYYPLSDKAYSPKDILQSTSSLLAPQDFSRILNIEFDHWELKGNEKILGLNSVILEGDLEEYQNHQIKMWVHTGTGIILKMEEKSNQNLVRSYEMKEITFNNKVAKLSATEDRVNNYLSQGTLKIKHIPGNIIRIEVNQSQNGNQVIFQGSSKDLIVVNAFPENNFSKEEIVSEDKISIFNQVEANYHSLSQGQSLIWEGDNKIYSIFGQMMGTSDVYNPEDLKEIAEEIIEFEEFSS